MEETVQKQISRIQAMTPAQKERFLRIYFHKSNHSNADEVVLTGEPE
tara:strand:+ start:320 stop:460 length:141 start_codon:yes stop_codon:yes gene_type:complete